MAHRTTWTNNVKNSPLTISLSATANDVLIAWAVSDSATGTFTWPTSFTEIANIKNSRDSQSLGVAIKNNASGSETSLDISTSSGLLIGGISAFSGRDNTTPQDVTAVTNNNNTGQSSPATITTAITPANNGVDLVSILGSDIGAAVDCTAAFSDTGSLSWTVRADIVGSTDAFYNVAIGSATQSTAAATTVTGTSTFASSTVGLSIVTIALRSGSSPDVTVAASGSAATSGHGTQVPSTAVPL